MNNIIKTIKESLEGFNDDSVPRHSDESLEWVTSDENKLYFNYLYPESQIELDPEKVKSHLLQSQIKVIGAVIEEIKKFKVDGSSKESWGYDNALKDQISSLNETLEFLKKSL